MTAIHPKTGGAALGGTLGVLITAILASIHGVHLAFELPGAISAFCAAAGAFLAPAGDPTLIGEPIAGELSSTFTPTPVTVNVHPPEAAPVPVTHMQAGAAQDPPA